MYRYQQTTMKIQSKVNTAQKGNRRTSNVQFVQVSMITTNVGIRLLATLGTITTITSATDSRKM